MPVDRTTYTNGSGRHAYEVEVYLNKDARNVSDFRRLTFEVHAVNRTVAAVRLERDGYEVCSVNMVG